MTTTTFKYAVLSAFLAVTSVGSARVSTVGGIPLSQLDKVSGNSDLFIYYTLKPSLVAGEQNLFFITQYRGPSQGDVYFTVRVHETLANGSDFPHDVNISCTSTDPISGEFQILINNSSTIRFEVVRR